MEDKYYRLEELTEQLMRLAEEAYTTYLQIKSATVNETEPDFFNQVKPFADDVQQLSEEWIQLATRWIEKERPRHLHIAQVLNTYEQLNIISVKAFYKDTGAKKFVEQIKSVKFILSAMREQLRII